MRKMSRKGRRSGPRDPDTLYIVLALVLVTGVVGYYIFTQSGATSSSTLDNTPVSSTVLNYLSGVSINTMNFIGPGATGATPIPSSNTTALLTSNGKPEVLYIGAEYCPYCAVERWAMIVALDKFGNFSGLEYMQSATTPEVFPNTATFTFVHATYTSNYVSFVPVEQYDNSNNHNPLMTATADQTNLMNAYDTKGNIPFVDIANRYTIVGSQIQPSVIANANWTQIASQLDNKSSAFAQNIDGAANRLIGEICKIDGGQPATVCSQSFAISAAYTRSPASGLSQLLVSDAVPRLPQSTAAASRFAATRLTSRV